MNISLEVWTVSALVVLATALVLLVVTRMYRVVGPNTALVVAGMRGMRTIKGGGTIVLPLLEQSRELSLELMSFDVAPTQDNYTKQGVAVTVEAVAQIKVKSDFESIRTAAEQFLSKELPARESLIRLVMEGHLRGIIGQLTVEQIVKEPEMVAERMRATCAADMNRMGLEVVSFTIKEVRDKNEYITNMGRPDIARVLRDANVAAAEAERDTAIKRAEATRAAAVAKAAADQERVAAETLSSRDQESGLSGDHQEAAGPGRQGLRDPGQRHAAAAGGRGGEGPADRERAAGQSARGGDPARREGARRHRVEAGRDRTAAHRDIGQRRAPARDLGGGGSCHCHPRSGRSGGRDHLQER
jgi:uncharacterized membrane protein YqiK